MKSAQRTAKVKPPPLPKSRRVLLLVDFINPLDFPGADDLLARALHAAQATALLKKKLAAKGVPAIYANDNFGRWHSDFKEGLANCLALKGPRGQIAQLLAPEEKDLVVLKPRHSAFFASPLDMLLREIGARELVIVGLATDMCVQLTTMDAYMHGYSAWVPSDCTAAESEASWNNALAHMRRVMKCSIRKSSTASAE